MEKTAVACWSTAANGYEKTNSHGLIETTIKMIKEKRRFVLIMHKGYQSGNMVVVDVAENLLLLDKPMDWPGTQKKIRVIFKDDANVWNYFTVAIIKEGNDTLKTQFPTELFRLQRRAHFRIEVPSGTTASFERGDKLYDEISVGNLSAGGMMICISTGDQISGLKDQATISSISVRLPKKISAAERAKMEPEDCYNYINVAKGVVVRSFPDEAKKTLCFGVQFALGAKEEKDLLQYVRQSELNALRKGVS